MHQDESFVDQLRHGVPEAYTLLVERFEAPLYRFFFCDHRDHHLAQEQSAETFAALVRSLRNLRGGGEQLPAFVFSTARHIQQRRWRAKGRDPLSLAAAQDLSDPRP